MARKKKYKGTVITEFKVGYKDGTIKYSVGDVFETANENSYNHLINIKKIK